MLMPWVNSIPALVSPRDAADGWYGWRDDSKGDVEMVMYLSFYHILPTNCFIEANEKWNKLKLVTLYGRLIVNSMDTFSDHYCQTRAFLPP